jgi:hypothetical protein
MEDFPLEVFGQILTYLDDTSLLSLAQVNHFFNYTVLEIFFGDKMMDVLVKEAKFYNVYTTSSRQGKESAVEALRLSLWLRRLEHVHHRPSRDNLLSDMRSLRSVIARMPALTSLHLDMRAVTVPLNNLNYDLEQAAAELCDMAVTKGCTSLKLAGLSSFTFSGDINSTSLELNGTTWQMTESSSSKNLTSVQICGALLMSPPFPYIFSFLVTQSTTIRYLHFDSSTSFVPQHTWKKILSSLNFPNLETFLFKHLATCVQVPHLVSFLGRHPTIKTLHLFPGHLYWSSVQELKQPILPSLEAVEGQSRVITWLCQNPCSCPNLQSAVIEAGEYNEANIKDLDEVLSSVGGPGRVTFDRIILIIDLYSPPWLTWMTGHVGDEHSELWEDRVVNLVLCACFSLPSRDEDAAHLFAR